ncbi:MAG: hypothetical protein HKN71_13300 [Gemmatimonadetes bacterium]|nr:hypothetical protein [Gemmatimonadota bacterium]
MKPSSRLLWGVVLALALAQIWALRVTWHAAPHPGGDNAGYVALAHSLATGQGYTELWDPAAPPHTKYPPVFPLLLAGAMAAGASTWAGLKTVPVLFGLLAVAATFLWARARRGVLWGGAVALLTGWSATLLYHAHYLLSDVPFVAFTLGALWLLEERRGLGGTGSGSAGLDGAEFGTVDGPESARSPETPVADPSARGGAGLPALAIAGAIACAGLAYFTRSAGLPLVVAVFAALALRRRFRPLAAGVVALGIPAVLWLLRGRNVVTDGAYVREFWMVDPYQPQLGELGVMGLVPRAIENVSGYLWGHFPAALTGAGAGGGQGATAVGVVVGLLAVVGLVLAARQRVGATEIFTVLYIAVILVWPVVWSGDRFALPLVPLALVYAGEAVAWGVARWKASAVVPALAGAAAVVLLSQGTAVATEVESSSACRAAARAGGPWACSGLGMVQFSEAARWSGANLDSEAAVLTRKPRIWYVMSGLATRTYPFVPYADSVLAVAERADASYVVLDLVGAQAQLLANAIGERPAAFCSVAGFGGQGGEPRTELLGILHGGARGPAGGTDQVQIVACPDPMRGRGVGLEPYTSSSPIPILTATPSPSPSP